MAWNVLLLAVMIVVFLIRRFSWRNGMEGTKSIDGFGTKSGLFGMASRTGKSNNKQ